jgi:hypothetical protein
LEEASFMKVHALKLSLSEQDLNDLIHKYLPADAAVEDLRVRVSPKGLVVTGIYPLFINVHFETHWDVGLDRGRVTARLDQFKAMGVPGNIFKSAVVKMMEDLAGEEEWVRIEGDTIRLDVDGCITKYVFPTQTNFKVLTCQEGNVVLEGKE